MKTLPSQCGFVTILGCPNAGKSTFLNQVTGVKVSIVSAKVQTTRRRVLGIVLRERTQIIFVDTPGIFQPKKPLEKAMVKAAWSSVGGQDQVLVMIDASLSSLESSQQILEGLKKEGISSFILVLNKIDRVPVSERLQRVASLTEGIPVEAVFIISALTGDGVDDLVRYLSEKMPQGPWLYEEDYLTDIPERELAAEVTREHLFHRLHDEIPYGLTVETEKWEHFKNGSIKINQVIIVNKESHRGIILGKGGRFIKGVGSASRRELEKHFECPVHLILHVKYDPDWLTKKSHYDAMGLGDSFK